jgi:putative membrane protein
MNRLLQCVSIAIGVTASATAFGQTTANPAAPAAGTMQSAGKLSTSDQKFVNEAASGGLFEVDAGKLAEKSADPQVRKFGARMVQDHSAADNKLKQIAAAQGGMVPSTLDQDHKQKLDRLASLHGQDFNRQYMAMMVQDHDADTQDFAKAAQDLKDPQLKQFAAQTLKTIKNHDAMAHQIANKTASSR